MKKIQKSMFLAAVISLMLSGCSIVEKQIVFDVNAAKGHTVFSINDTKCNIKEANIYLCNYRNLYGEEYGVDLWECSQQQSDLESYIKDVTIDELVRVYCMDIIAENKKIALSEDEKSKVDSAADEYYKSLTEDEIDYMGVGKADIKNAYKNYAVAQKLYTSLTQGVNTEVSDDDARVVHLEQIYVTNSDTAAAVAQKLGANENFGTLANSYNEAASIDVYAARGQLPEEVEDVAFNMNDNEISQMITTDNGYYFIKCVSKLDQKKTDENKTDILVQREQQQFNSDYDEFMESARFDLNKNLWDDVSIADQTGIQTDSFFAVYDKYFNE